jgi:MFS family permease
LSGWSEASSRYLSAPGFGTIWSTVALDLVGFGLVFPILPIYARRFHVSPAGATGLVAVFAAATFVFSPIWRHRRLSDGIGRKPVLLISLAGTAIGSLLTGVAGVGTPYLAGATGMAGGFPLFNAGRVGHRATSPVA